MESNIFKIGNSLAMRIPMTYVKEMGINKGDKMNMIKEGNELRISKADDTSIEELFKGYEGNYQAEEIDWGEPKGDEVW